MEIPIAQNSQIIIVDIPKINTTLCCYCPQILCCSFWVDLQFEDNELQDTMAKQQQKLSTPGSLTFCRLGAGGFAFCQ